MRSIYGGLGRADRKNKYIPVRYIVAALFSILETLAVILSVFVLAIYIPHFYIAVIATQVGCILRIATSDDNPDYKVPWLLFVTVLPVVGFMLYFLFYSRKLQKKFIRRLEEMHTQGCEKDDSALLAHLEKENKNACSQAKMLTKIASTYVFDRTHQTYFRSGEEMHPALLADLLTAKRFIFISSFIIEDGIFWGSILNILRKKAAEGVTVRLLYDDIGCMRTLPGDYDKQLRRVGIEATPFSRLRGNADSEFNNRNHRKITVIDGKIGYTGGVNLADEYINAKEKYGHWKDSAIRLEGEAVWALTALFLADYGISVKRAPAHIDNLYPPCAQEEDTGYLIPFGDGPNPIYQRRVGQNVIQNMVAQATRYVYITTPYLIIGNELCTTLENAALRGVDVKIILPHIPDKKVVFEISRTYYKRLSDAGVKIYEYAPGFLHAKNYLVDDEIGMIGTINLDYRSLVHHFENGVWMYRTPVLAEMKTDFEATLARSIPISEIPLRAGLLRRLLRACVRLFAPLL